MADISFYSTFYNFPSDTGQRRTADITAGFYAGTWGGEYMSFNVGYGGVPNDTQNVTLEKMRILGSGFVGIGTTNPSSLLTVSGGGSFGSGYQGFSAPTNGLIIQGNVGIGTTNPGLNALQVSGNVVTSGFTSNATNTVFNFDTLSVPFVSSTQVLASSSIGIGTTSPNSALEVYGTVISRQQAPAFAFLGDIDQAKWTTKLGGYNLSFLSDSGSFTGFENITFLGRTYQTAVQMTSTGGMNVKGSVGIGTASPNAALNVWGSQPYSTVGANPSSGQLILNTTTGSERLYLAAAYTGGVGSVCYIQSSDYYNSVDHGQVLLLNPLGGGVGINTTGAGYALDVAGDINCSGSYRQLGILQPKLTVYGSVSAASSFDTSAFDLVNFNTVEIRIELYTAATGSYVQIQALDTAGTVYTAQEQGYVVFQGNRGTIYQYGGTATIIPYSEQTVVGPNNGIIRISGVSMTGQSGAQRYQVWWSVTGCWAGVGQCTDTGQAWFLSSVTINRLRFNMGTSTMTGKYSLVHYV